MTLTVTQFRSLTSGSDASRWTEPISRWQNLIDEGGPLAVTLRNQFHEQTIGRSYAFFVVIQRASDGTIGIIDPIIECDITE